MYTNTFEAGLPATGAAERWITNGNPAGANYVVTSEAARVGNAALAVSLNRLTDTVSYRSEWRLRDHDATGNADSPNAEWGAVHGIGFSIYLPDDWEHDPDAAATFCQMHAAGPTPGLPPIQIQVNPDGHWRVDARGAAAPLGADPDVSQTWVLHPAVAGRWHDWAIRYVFDGAGTAGALDVWYNRTHLVAYAGKLGYEEEDAPYTKFGIYVPGWDSGGSIDFMRVLFDQIVVGKGAEVSLRALSPATDYYGQPRVALL